MTGAGPVSNSPITQPNKVSNSVSSPFDAIGSIAGGVIGAGTSIIGSLISSKAQDDMLQDQLSAQREFAQNSVQWRVKDAEKAGIHPLYALGAQGVTYTPSYSGGSDLGQGIAQAGASIQSAFMDYAQMKMMSNQLQRQELENGLLANELASASGIAGQASNQQANLNLAMTKAIQNVADSLSTRSIDKNGLGHTGYDLGQSRPEYESENDIRNTIGLMLEGVPAGREFDFLRSFTRAGAVDVPEGQTLFQGAVRSLNSKVRNFAKKLPDSVGRRLFFGF